MTQIKITKVTSDDFKSIQIVGRQTFFEAFAQYNTDEDMAQYLQENFNGRKIRTEIGTPGSTFYIAWRDENPVGYLKVNTDDAQTEIREQVSLEIERIYVRSNELGKNIGQLLYEKALKMARHQKKEYIWLGVWEQNLRAIEFYKRNGFIAFDRHIFKMGKEDQTDIMMKKILL